MTMACANNKISNVDWKEQQQRRRRRRRRCQQQSKILTIFQMIVLSLTLTLLFLLDVVRSELAYPLGCSQKDAKYYDYESYSFPPTSSSGIIIRHPKDYMLVRRLGAGKFSDVFEAVDVQMEQRLKNARVLFNKDNNNTGNNNNNRRQPLSSLTTISDASAETMTTATATVTASTTGVTDVDDTSIDPRTLVVIKCLKPVAERKIKRELLILQHASKLPNLARLLAIVIPPDYSNGNNNNSENRKRYQLQSMPSLILEHAGVDSQWLCHGKDYYLTEYEIKYFLYHLLVALDQLHSCGIMHRDVKPRNVLIDRTDMTLMLIDLGLADFYLPTMKYNVRVASRHYKSPELLLGNENYDYSLDMWGVGCILAGLLLRREPFFRGKDNMDQLGTIVAILGTEDLHAYISKAKINVTPEIRKVIAKYTLRGRGNKKEWSTLIPSPSSSSPNNDNSDNMSSSSSSLEKGKTTKEEGTATTTNANKNVYIPSEDGIDLLSKLLIYDHTNRLTAKQAMDHKFFDSVRGPVNRRIQEQILQSRGFYLN